MFAETSCFVGDYFKIIRNNERLIEVQSKNTQQFWLILKFKKKNFPKTVLYHRHTNHDRYHVHYYYNDDNALLGLAEIYQHDKYVLNRNNNNVCKISFDTLINLIPKK